MNTTKRKSAHTILINNFKNNEIVTYSIIIFKGYIENFAQLKCQNTYYLHACVQSKSYYQITLSNKGKFKLLVELQLGVNIINFSFCCTSTNITIEFKPQTSIFSIVPVYIICCDHDGTFQAPDNEPNTPLSACRRVTTGCKLIQSVYAEKLHEAGFDRKTFNLEPTHVFHSKLSYRKAYKMNQIELWYYFAREIMSSPIGNESKKYLVFLSCTRYKGSEYKGERNHEDLIKLTEGYVAFGGEALALVGTACLYTWPEDVQEIERRFKDDSLVDRSKFFDDSCFRGTIGGCFSTTLGAALHELSHTFDLGHCEAGIMSRGFDNIQEIFISSCDINTNYVKCAKLRKILNFEGIYWTENCLTLLNYHKWFNNYTTKTKATFQYNETNKIIKSTAGLRIIEIRRESDEMVLYYWLFLENVLKYSFCIGDKNIEFRNIILIVEDNEGNILKKKL